jgi:arginase
MLVVPYHLDEHLPDLGASTALPDGDVWSRLAALYNDVAATVEGAPSPAVVLSGDCTVSIGIAAGLQRAGLDPAVVWIDAHGDVQTLETTTSGYIGGMALRFLLGYRSDLVAERVGLRPLAEDRVLLVDARDLDPPEAEYLASARVHRSTVDELSAETLPPGPLLVNLDLDVIDPAELPGLRYPAPDGPAASAVLRAAQTVLASGRVVALNIACTWHPGHPDPGGTRTRLISRLLDNLPGA